jgi:hypothetical protein
MAPAKRLFPLEDLRELLEELGQLLAFGAAELGDNPIFNLHIFAERPLDEVVALGSKFDEHAPPVFLRGPPADQAAFLEAP